LQTNGHKLNEYILYLSWLDVLFDRTELDQLSNSVVDLIKNDKLDEAEVVSKRLLKEYPDQIDCFERFGQVYEARGEKHIAADYYQKAADFAKVMPGFDKEGVEYCL